MTSYIFVFGRTPQLALLELQCLGQPAQQLVPGIGMGQADFAKDAAAALLDILGGTIKIAKVIGEVASLNPTTLADILCSPKLSQERITFGISLYDDTKSTPGRLLVSVKDILATRVKHVRFIQPREGTVLASVVIQKQHVDELILVKRGQKFFIGRTLAVQDFEQWNLRDYGRPFADPRAGMLPPKIARMVVNIAVGKQATAKTVLDPFCGMGTVIGEALLRGCSCVGSDQAQSVVERAKANIAWLESKYPQIDPSRVRFAVAEAAHSSENLPPGSVDAIVTEPFMGAADMSRSVKQTNFNPARLRNTVKGLEKLYIGCLRDWYQVLKPGGRIVMALPEYALGSRTFFVKKTIDSCEKLGYTTQHGPIEYSRPQAVVRREFFVFKKS